MMNTHTEGVKNITAAGSGTQYMGKTDETQKNFINYSLFAVKIIIKDKVL